MICAINTQNEEVSGPQQNNKNNKREPSMKIERKQPTDMLWNFISFAFARLGQLKKENSPLTRDEQVAFVEREWRALKSGGTRSAD